jgi:LmbE family N-acetylglucosaminyl deacetylase
MAGSGRRMTTLDLTNLIREGELMHAAQILNLRSVRLLDYTDGDLDQAKPKPIIHQIAAQIRRIRPQIVLTFDPYGVYGHPDHIAIAQFTTAAIVEAAGGTQAFYRVFSFTTGGRKQKTELFQNEWISLCSTLGRRV